MLFMFVYYRCCSMIVYAKCLSPSSPSSLNSPHHYDSRLAWSLVKPSPARYPPSILGGSTSTGFDMECL
uniref:Putative secreted protein n=1 Tax=Anopheles triannulatus TaxID=58253 RepID=A0A2M4B3Y2_9DIPT